MKFWYNQHIDQFKDAEPNAWLLMTDVLILRVCANIQADRFVDLRAI